MTSGLEPWAGTRMDPNDAIGRANYLFFEYLDASVKTLLEKKHLYQSLVLDLAAIESQTTAITYPDKQQYAEETFRSYADRPWKVVQPALAEEPSIGPPDDGKSPKLSFPTIKLFCESCDAVEPYNLVSAEDATERLRNRVPLRAKGTFQIFLITYLCQGCKMLPEFILIRREGLRLAVVGRTPIAHVDVPAAIPKSHRKYFAEAVVAFQTGNVLPALFMLRTFIEQFAASQVSSTGLRADDILDKYMATLVAPVRDHFPSLRDVYGRLSEAMHNAREDRELFERSSAEISEHFEARRLYKVGAG